MRKLTKKRHIINISNGIFILSDKNKMFLMFLQEDTLLHLKVTVKDNK